MIKKPFAIHFALAMLCMAGQASAQSGANLQGTAPAQPLSSDASVVPRAPGASAAPKIAPGGASVVVQEVALSGNKSVGTATLLQQLGALPSTPLDMAGLNQLAQHIEAYYHAAGYPFAQAYLPPQDLKGGVLRIAVIEGQYGTIHAAGKDKLPEGAQPFLDYGLHAGDAIQNLALERTMLILDDQPGMKIRPVIKPGAEQGAADLTVNVERSSYTSGDIGFDNTGARSTGEYRLRGALNINSPFRYGDKVTLNALTTDEAMWLGSIDYETPLGASGLRGQVGFAHTNYRLAGSFTALNATGYADVSTAKLSYPLVRSQATNVLLSLGWQHKDLQDQYATAGVTRSKRSDGIPVGVQFDKRDTLLGGGVTYGSLSWLSGNLVLGADLTAADASSAKTNGSFTKTSLDIARIQKIAGELSLYGRFSGQWADKNLDSSEKFNLGGYYGVRAYPLGEGTGDTGWLTQLELRYSLGDVTPFLLYDRGHAQTNAQAWDVTSASTRDVEGTGVGVRTLFKGWTLDATLSWQASGGASQADNQERNPRLFFMLGRRF